MSRPTYPSPTRQLNRFDRAAHANCHIVQEANGMSLERRELLCEVYDRTQRRAIAEGVTEPLAVRRIYYEELKMASDEQFAASVRYGAVPVCLIRCPSGNIAVTEGLNNNFRRTLAILAPADVLDFVLALEPEAAPPPPSSLLAELDPFDI